MSWCKKITKEDVLNDIDKLLRNTCKWKFDDNDYYDTECGNAFNFFDSTLKESKFLYCPYCGKMIEEVKENENKDNDSLIKLFPSKLLNKEIKLC